MEFTWDDPRLPTMTTAPRLMELFVASGQLHLVPEPDSQQEATTGEGIAAEQDEQVEAAADRESITSAEETTSSNLLSPQSHQDAGDFVIIEPAETPEHSSGETSNHPDETALVILPERQANPSRTQAVGSSTRRRRSHGSSSQEPTVTPSRHRVHNPSNRLTSFATHKKSSSSSDHGALNCCQQDGNRTWSRTISKPSPCGISTFSSP